MEIQNKLNQEARQQAGRSRITRWAAAAAAALLVVGGALGAIFAASPSKTRGPQVLSAESFSDYHELYSMIESLNGPYYSEQVAIDAEMRWTEVAEDAETEMPAPAPEAAMDDSIANQLRADAMAGDGHSETNVQVAGVDEADIVKTDGKYIYYVCRNTLYIAEAIGKDTKVLSSTPIDTDLGELYQCYASEMYLCGDRLMIVSAAWSLTAVTQSRSAYAISQPVCAATLFDLSDRAKPREIVTLGQSGSYVSSRMVGDMVYLITSQYVYIPLEKDPLTFVPSTSVGGEAVPLPAGDILVCGAPSQSAYTVIGSINIAKGTAFESAKALFGGTGEIYCNGKHLLIAQSEYTYVTGGIAPDQLGRNVQVTTSECTTKLVLFSLDGGRIEKTASGTVPGTLLNQFAMDEYKGVFRVVTTVNKWVERVYTDGRDRYEYDSEDYNCLYTLDASLNILGKVEKLAENEWVKSVRFDGDIGYFVTFRQTDPLFAVDLSVPARPRVLSALKIPGFSEYLHVYGDGLLFGIGYQADEKTGVRQGVKLSMFDVSNKADVKEIVTERLDAYDTAVGRNHKAILVDAARSIIAFPADNAYYIYRYDAAKGFELLKKIGVSYDIRNDSLRGLFIGRSFYVVSDTGVTIIDMASWEIIARLGW